MTPKAQRIAIGNAVFPHGKDHLSEYWELPTDEGIKRVHWPDLLPDYLSDLNAMHEAEKVLADEKYHTMTNWLNCIVNKEKPSGRYIVPATHLRYATAAQRAEAFLRTLNLWQEGDKQ